jgi:hypothetical protein
MRRFLLIACASIAVLALSTTALAGKPATFKAGAYNGKLFGVPFTVALKRGSCKAAAGQKRSSLKLCVSLTKAPQFECHIPSSIGATVTAFATPVQLPATGKVSQKTPVSLEGFPGGPPTTGEATFAVAFKKNGTATGTFGLSVIQTFGAQKIPCTGGEKFAAKLH